MSHWKKKASMPTQMGKASLTHKNAVASPKLAYIAPELVCPSGEQITNGGFETGDFTGWDSDFATVHSGDSHSGNYHAEIQYDSCTGKKGWIKQSFVKPIPVECVKSFGFWSCGWCSDVSYNIVRVYIGYDDTTETIKDFNSLPWYPIGGYVLCDLKSVLVSGKKIASIKIEAVECPMLVDDVSLVC